MVIVYKIVHVEQEAQRNVGGISMMSMNLSPQSIYRLSYRKDEPTVGPHPLFAFQDLASAKEHAGTDPQVSIWEAEAPSSEPAPIWIPDPYDVYISNYWPWEHENVPTRGWGGGISPPIYWSARNQGALAMSWRLAPSGTVLCPSITLRRLVDSIDVGIVNNS